VSSDVVRGELKSLPYIINKLNERLLHLLVFHAYVNEMHGSRSKISSKNLVRQRCAEGFNSGVKGLMINVTKSCNTYSIFLWDSALV
jgi:hypothetical protein